MPFISENELERALVKAAKNPEAAPDFYRLLLESDLLVMGTAEGRESATETFTVTPGSRFNLVRGMKNGEPFLPVFSSLLRMQEYIKQESKFLSIKGRALLELTRGAAVILNPASEYGKELSAQEVTKLLDPNTAHTQRTITGEAEYPVALVETLTGVFAARPDVEAAWMIQVSFSGQEAPQPVVGIETAGDWPSLAQAIAEAAQRFVPDMSFDLQRIDRARPQGLTDALLQVPPFYQRRASGPRVN
jgi:hypothetical protein